VHIVPPVTWLVVTIFVVVFVTLLGAAYFVWQARPSIRRGPANSSSGEHDRPRLVSRTVEPVAATNSNATARVVATLIVMAAIGAFFLSSQGPTYEEQRDEIASVDNANNQDTTGAPQQDVVNGWTTIDYLELLSVQQEESNNRRDFLLVLLVSGVAIAAARRV
jgi:hypothetical protein